MSNELAVKIEGGLVKCETMPEALSFCKTICESGLAPRGFDTPQKVFIAIQQGKELGLSPIAALNVICVINGRPSLWGRGVPAIVQASKKMESWAEWEEGEGDNLKAFCKSKRRGIEGERVSSFSVMDAKRAGLWGKAGPWTNYPKDQLMYKARARCLGILYADALCGLPIFEDIRDNPPERKEPKDVPVNDPLLSGEGAISGNAPDGGNAIDTPNPDDVYRQLKGELESCETCEDLEKIKALCADKKEILSADHKNSLKEIYAENAKRVKGQAAKV